MSAALVAECTSLCRISLLPKPAKPPQRVDIQYTLVKQGQEKSDEKDGKKESKG
jgi:hypothetical protein